MPRATDTRRPDARSWLGVACLACALVLPGPAFGDGRREPLLIVAAVSPGESGIARELLAASVELEFGLVWLDARELAVAEDSFVEVGRRPGSAPPWRLTVDASGGFSSLHLAGQPVGEELGTGGVSRQDLELAPGAHVLQAGGGGRRIPAALVLSLAEPGGWVRIRLATPIPVEVVSSLVARSVEESRLDRQLAGLLAEHPVAGEHTRIALVCQAPGRRDPGDASPHPVLRLGAFSCAAPGHCEPDLSLAVRLGEAAAPPLAPRPSPPATSPSTPRPSPSIVLEDLGEVTSAQRPERPWRWRLGGGAGVAAIHGFPYAAVAAGVGLDAPFWLHLRVQVELLATHDGGTYALCGVGGFAGLAPRVGPARFFVAAGATARWPDHRLDGSPVLPAARGGIGLRPGPAPLWLDLAVDVRLHRAPDPMLLLAIVVEPGRMGVAGR